MAHTTEIGIFLLAHTKIERGEVLGWLNEMGADAYDPSFDDKTDSELLVELAGRRCYKSFQPGLNPNVTKIRTDLAEYIDNILKSGHGSVLEHATYTFAIEGVSRVFTGEMNRHRAGWAISEGSMRYIRFDDMGWWMPPSMQASTSDFVPAPDSAETILKNRLIMKKLLTQKVFQRAFQNAENEYKELLKIWEDELAPASKFHAKKEITSMMRRIVPMGIATGGIWTGNIRAIRHVLTMRCSPAAEEEILYVFSIIMKRIRDLEPNLFGDFEQDENGFFKPTYYKV